MSGHDWTPPPPTPKDKAINYEKLQSKLDTTGNDEYYYKLEIQHGTWCIERVLRSGVCAPVAEGWHEQELIDWIES